MSFQEHDSRFGWRLTLKLELVSQKNYVDWAQTTNGADGNSLKFEGHQLALHLQHMDAGRAVKTVQARGDYWMQQGKSCRGMKNRSDHFRNDSGSVGLGSSLPPARFHCSL
jgi:hypothetical protein